MTSNIPQNNFPDPHQNYGTQAGTPSYGDYGTHGASPSPYGAFPNAPEHNNLVTSSPAPGAWKRFFALFIDSLVLAPLVLILAFFMLVPAFQELSEQTETASYTESYEVQTDFALPTGTMIIFGLVIAVAWLGYRILMETKYEGSLGKKALGMRVVGEDGTKLSAQRSFIRNGWYLLGLVPYIGSLVQPVIGILIAVDPEKRHPFDKWAKARVLNK